jgi:DNA polymerase-3 subunit epsilon
MSMFEKPVVYVDIETSGSNMYRSKIIEVGAIRVENGDITDSFTSLVNPGTPLPYWITKLTGITDNDVVQAPFFEDIAYQLFQILNGAVFIAHNVRFDYSYIKRELEQQGYSFNPNLLCTVRLSRAMYPEHKGHSLQKIIERHDIKTKERHRAFDDALAIKDFSELAYREKGEAAFNEAIKRQFKTKTLPPHLADNGLNDITNKPGVYVFEDEKGQPLYIGKSVALRKRILSHFSSDVKVTKEMKIAQGTHNVRVIETSTELEALLLESKMVKELLPLHNRQLRHVSSHFVLLKETDEQGYTRITIADKDLARYSELDRVYGMYTAKSKARAALQTKLKTYDLCSKLLGLEHCKDACFLYQLGKCNGACIGKESPVDYNRRVELALDRTRIESWPFKTAIALSQGDNNYIVLDKWIVLGYVHQVDSGDVSYEPIERQFDIDTYRILRSYIRNNLSNLKILPLRDIPPELQIAAG